MRELHKLADVGAVRLERPTHSARSEQWSLEVEGATWEPHGAAVGVAGDSTPVLTLVGLLGALVATPRTLWIRVTIGIGVGLALVALGSLIRSTEPAS
jgi:hypothetical protein